MRITETSASDYFYHLSNDNEASCGQITAICGTKFMGWKTKISLKTWGSTTDLNEKYCEKCTKMNKAILNKRKSSKQVKLEKIF